LHDGRLIEQRAARPAQSSPNSVCYARPEAA
jgi:hypothetical protein